MFSIIKRHWPLLLPCFLIYLLAGLGQTFLFAQFTPYFEQDYGLSKTGIGLIYSLATLIASFNLPSIGKLYDKAHLNHFSIFVASMASIGMLILGFAPPHVFFLFLGLYLVRGFCQVVLPLLASNILGQMFGKMRGKAIAASSLGMSLSEGLLPSAAIVLIASLGYRKTFIVFSGILFLAIIFISIFLLSKVPKTPLYFENEEKLNQVKFSISDGEKFWFLKQKWPFVLMLVGSFIPFTVTGLFFHQSVILSLQNWSTDQIKMAFLFFSLFHILGNFFWGHIIDRFQAKTIFPLGTVLPFFSILSLIILPSSWGPIPYMATMGISVGFMGMMRGTLWAELFEHQFIGRIRGVDGLFLVLGTLIPAIFLKD